MSTQSNAVPESPVDSQVIAPAATLGDSANVLVGATRIVGEPFDLYRAAGCRRRRDVRLPDQPDWSAAQHARLVGAGPGASARRARHAVQPRCVAAHADRVPRRGLLLARRAARRASRSQHPVLEVAAGFGSYDRALEGEHSSRGSAAAHLRDHRCPAVDHAAAEHRSAAGERCECRDAVDTACRCSRWNWCCSTV